MLVCIGPLLQLRAPYSPFSLPIGAPESRRPFIARDAALARLWGGINRSQERLLEPIARDLEEQGLPRPLIEPQTGRVQLGLRQTGQLGVGISVTSTTILTIRSAFERTLTAAPIGRPFHRRPFRERLAEAERLLPPSRLSRPPPTPSNTKVLARPSLPVGLPKHHSLSLTESDIAAAATLS